LLNPAEGAPKTRLNTADRVGNQISPSKFGLLSDRLGIHKKMLIINRCKGNTPLHLAMDSGHAEAAVLLIEAGADRDRVSPFSHNIYTFTFFALNTSATLGEFGR
jgi:26S proteasome non-ATPase regulatory subunit 10